MKQTFILWISLVYHTGRGTCSASVFSKCQHQLIVFVCTQIKQNW